MNSVVSINTDNDPDDVQRVEDSIAGHDAVQNAVNNNLLDMIPARFGSINTEMNEAEVASILARELSSNEFEFLVRERIRLRMARLHKDNPNLSESHAYVALSWYQESPTIWTVRAGETYSKSTTEEGEVLAMTFDDMEARHYRKERNKLLLLPSAAR